MPLGYPTEEIKAALYEQAFHGCTRVGWGVAQVMSVKKSRGHLLVLLRGRPRWYEIEAVTIERLSVCPTGACDLGEDAPSSGGYQIPTITKVAQ